MYGYNIIDIFAGICIILISNLNHIMYRNCDIVICKKSDVFIIVIHYILSLSGKEKVTTIRVLDLELISIIVKSKLL